ncbi:glutathione S-transferase family protein [Polaromonas sp. YR568]|uniref:glutathione S-transferase family protein n=1 Tax=Polaromonas sp. YR568 TaxID=1855301 RepID=UPI00313786C2
MQLTLISHTLCPYVQRAAIALMEKGVAFERRDIDLANKPAWFLAISPLGKTPVLLVDGQPIFESAAICEYLDDTLLPRLHPADALQRAQHRGWMEFGSSVVDDIAAFYNAADAGALEARRQAIAGKFLQVEQALHPSGPYFSGAAFTLVDAVFGPVFRYFDVLEGLGESGFLPDPDRAPRVHAWRAALAQRPSMQRAVSPHYARELEAFLRRRDTEISHRLADHSTATAHA